MPAADLGTDIPAFPMDRDRARPFDPPPAMRELPPISRVRIWNGDTAWLITKYKDQKSVLADQRFSVDARMPGYPHATPGVRARRTQSRSFIVMDNPEHDVQRRMLTKDFMVKRVNELRPRVERLVNELIADMVGGGQPADLVTSIALPVPSLVICELLGVPYAEHEFFQEQSRRLISRQSTPAEGAEAVEALRDYLLGLVDSKLATPGDDLTSRLVTEQLSVGSITREELADIALLILVAGHETTANMIALGVLALLEHPDQRAILIDATDATAVANCVEELLRYLNVAHSGRRRVALEDVEVAGQLIRAGEGVIIPNDVGNRDETVFPDPDMLDLERDARQHLTFGFGIHQCIGASLAKMELQVTFKALFSTLPGLQLAVPLSEISFRNDMAVYGVHALPVTW